MQDSTSKEKILKKVRKALINKSPREAGNIDFESEIYTGSEDPFEVMFAQKFSALNGRFVFCENETEFTDNLSILIKDYNWVHVFCFEQSVKQILEKGSIQFSDNQKEIKSVDIGVTSCECLVARTGTVMISSRQAAGRRLPVYSNIHIVVAYTSQLVYNIKDGLKFIKQKYADQIPSMISAITGPSRTADIEKTLVQGAHGPKEIFVFLIDDSSDKS